MALYPCRISSEQHTLFVGHLLTVDVDMDVEVDFNIVPIYSNMCYVRLSVVIIYSWIFYILFLHSFHHSKSRVTEGTKEGKSMKTKIVVNEFLKRRSVSCACCMNSIRHSWWTSSSSCAFLVFKRKDCLTFIKFSL